MKKLFTLKPFIKRSIILFIILMLIKTNVTAQISGAYTINSGAAASASNYKSFTAAVNDLQGIARGDGGPSNNTGSGVTGNTIFNVSANTYTEQINIPAITGVSFTKKVTFIGAGTSSTLLTFAGTNANPHTLRLNACQYIYFRNMAIKNSGTTDGWIVNFLNSSKCSVTGCLIEFTGSAQTSSASNLACIVVNGSTTAMATSSSNVDSLNIDTCIINYGYYNVYTYIGSGPTNPIIQFRKDSFNNAYYSSIYFWLAGTLCQKVLNNTFSLRTGASNQFAIWSWSNPAPSASMYSEISYNRFTNLNGYGIATTYAGGSGVNGRIYNNIFGGGTRGATNYISGSGAACCAFSGWSIFNNTFYMDYGSGVSNGIDLGNNTSGANVSIKNNIFYNASATANNVGINVPNSGAVGSIDYNNYYTNYTGGTLLSINGNNYNSTNYTVAYPSGGGVKSLNNNVSFVSSTDYHHTTACLKGQSGLTGITTDYDGTSRPTPPSMGAFEPTGSPASDIGLYSLVSPVFPVSTGIQPLKVRVKNYGTNLVSSMKVYYTINSNPMDSQVFSFSPSLAICDTVTVTFTNNITINAGTNTLKVFTALSGDANLANDTASATICPVLNGNYTIDASIPTSSTNFQTFNAVASALSCGGVTGPVKFNVATGTFNEQVNLSLITGSSSTNTVTFDGGTGNAATRILTYNANSSANYTVRLGGVNYIKFKNLTINATNATYGTALSISGSSTTDSFYNVIFNSVVTTTNSNNISVISSTSGNNRFMYFDTCKINNGAYGSYFTSSGSSTSTENLCYNNCDFTNQYACGIYNNQLNGLILTQNRISTNSALTTYLGMYNWWIYINAASNKPMIIGNKIWGAVGGHGMHNSYFGVNSGTSGKRPVISNNMIQIGSGSNATFGIRVSNDYGSTYAHNSVNIGTNQTANTSSAAFFETVSSSSDTVINNVFAAYNGAPSVRMDVPSSYTLCNNNNLYTTGAYIGYVGATPYTTIASWRVATTKDAASLNVAPVFTSNTDLHTNSGSLNNAGIVYAPVITDYDKQRRCPNGSCPGGALVPDIGCDEFNPYSLDATIVSVDAPVTLCSGGSSSVFVTMKNMGSTTLTSDSIKWSVNGIQKYPSYFWSGSIAQGVSTSSLNIGSYTFGAGVNTIKVWVKDLNTPGGLDQNNSNDTITYVPAAQLSGVYTIGGSSPDYATFTAAATDLNTKGVCGPVYFNVRQGTYSERIQLNAISGSSATNYITFRPDPTNLSPVVITIGTNSSLLDNHTIFLNGTSFITFRGLTISNTSSGSFKSAVRFALAQDSVRLVSNIISSAVSTVNSLNEAVINQGNAAIDSISRFTLDSNIINNGSYGVYLIGNTSISRFENKNKIRNNQILGSYFYGIYSQFQRNIDILNNVITMSASSSSSAVGIYMDYNDSFRVEGNSINKFGQYGLFLSSANYQSGTGTRYSTVFNNMIGGAHSSASAYGIYINPITTFASRYLRIYHNSVSVNSTSTGAAFFIQQTSAGMYDFLDIKNNSFANFGTGTYACYFYYNSGTPITNLIINYNNYYTSGSNKFVIGQSGYSTATGGSPTFNANSKSGDPIYINNLTNLHSMSSQLNDAGTNLLLVTTDIDGDTRPISPSVTVDMGADEYNIPQYNIGVSATVSPACPLLTGLQNVVLTFKNYGAATITSSNVNYKVGINGSVKTISWTGSLASTLSTNATFNGANQYNFTGMQIDTIFAWTDSPNGFADGYSGNDSLTYVIYQPLSGVYTVGGASPSFSNFTAVANALNCAGITGPVTFKVRAGTYTESISMAAITGSSSTNTITFESEAGVAANVILQTSSGAYTCRMTNTKYISFKNMTVRSATGNSFLINPSLGDSAYNVSITGCVLTSSWGGGTATAVIYANGNTPNLRIANNSITNSFGIALIGISSNINTYTRGIVLDSNNFNTSINDVYSPIYMYYANAPKIRYNTIARSASGGALTGDISNITGAMEFAYNKIHGQGVNGVKMQNMNINGETSPVLIHNNFMADNNANVDYYALDVENSNYVNIYNNSLYQHNNTATSYALRVYASAARSNIRIVNNNIVSNTSGTSSIPLSINGNTLANAKAQIAECNYNNYFVVGGTGVPLIKLFSTTYTSVAAMQGIVYTSPANNDMNSINVNPVFTNASASAVDLHIPAASALIGTGNILSSITNDIDNTPRAFPPCIGADEVNNVIRTNTSDYIVSSSCPTFSGSTWMNVRDASGNLVFAINPNGNNLGATCWGVRINGAVGLRTDSTKLYTTGVNTFGYLLDRNVYISPTTQPSTPVSIRFFSKNAELQELKDSVFNKYGTVINFSDIDISKYRGSVDLNPKNNSGSSSDFSLLNATAGAFGSDYYLEVSTSSFSEFNPSYVPSSILSPLPITMLSFIALPEGENGVLNWSTATEKDNDHFDIERSTNGIDYIKVGEVISQGNSISKLDYGFIDKSASSVASKLYYRIKQVDYNGTTTESDIRSIMFSKVTKTSISIYPNPASEFLSIAYNNLEVSERSTVKVFDLTGKLVSQLYIQTTQQTGVFELPLQKLTKGVYVVQISNSTFNQNVRFVKQ